MGKPNGVATLEDFRAAHEEQEPVQRIKLPKLGKHVLVRKPSQTWFATNGYLPLALAAVVGSGSPEGAKTLSERVTALRNNAVWMKRVLERTLVEPKCTDELLGVIDIEDAGYIVQFASGVIEVAKEGGEAQNLESFRPA